MIGITISVSKLSEISPPNIGEEILFITSAPSPTASITGIRPKIFMLTAMSTGRRLLSAPSIVAWKKSRMTKQEAKERALHEELKKKIKEEEKGKGQSAKRSSGEAKNNAENPSAALGVA